LKDIFSDIGYTAVLSLITFEMASIVTNTVGIALKSSKLSAGNIKAVSTILGGVTGASLRPGTYYLI
jgi:hypothetical protein